MALVGSFDNGGRLFKIGVVNPDLIINLQIRRYPSSIWLESRHPASFLALAGCFEALFD